MNRNRVILGGLSAGGTLVGLEILFHYVLEWGWIPGGLERFVPSPLPLERSYSPLVGILYILTGIWTLWLYAAVRSRYSSGPRTAARAGLATWILVSLVAGFFSLVAEIPIASICVGLGLYLLALLAAVVVGSSLYQDEEGVPAKASPATGVPASSRPPPAATKRATPRRAAPRPVSKPAPPAKTQPAAASKTATSPSATDSVEKKQRELQESVVAMQLDDKVAVREVLRVFKNPLSPEEIVDHLKFVNWNFGEAHPRVIVMNALKALIEKGKAKKTNGKYQFSR